MSSYRRFNILILLLISSLCWNGNSFAQAPPNDLCSNAIDITTDIANGNCVTGTTLNATKTVSGNYTYCGTSSAIGSDIWYKFTTPASLPGCYTFSVSRGTATGEIEMYLFGGSCLSPTLLLDKCECSNKSVIDFSSFDISSGWAANTTYYFRLNNQNATGGSFSICIKQVNGYAVNDECSGALTLGTGTNTFMLGATGCTYSSNATDPTCTGTTNGDIGGITAWFTFTATANGSISITGIPQADCNNGIGTIKVCIYKGTCGSLTQTGSPGAPGQGRSGTTCNGGTGGGVTISSVTAGQVYYAAVYAVSGSQNCRISMTLTNAVGPPLTVELLSFNAKRLHNEEVLLAWATASEINNDYFSVERSMDGDVFETVEEVKGNGNSKYTMQYSVVDRNPFRGILSYYRLKQTDYDGAFKYSNTTAVSAQESGKLEFISLVPDAFSANITYLINGEQAGGLTLDIIDLQGRVVSSSLVAAATGMLSVSQLTGGIYMARLSSKDQAAINKFVFSPR